MLKIGEKTFESRLLLGTGKYTDATVQQEAIDASASQILTFAVRRLDLFDKQQPNFLESLDLTKYDLLPNTAGAKTAEEAVRLAKLARASG
ncbi:MAG: thiazole synthase, partial [Exiguobacterium sp.]